MFRNKSDVPAIPLIPTVVNYFRFIQDRRILSGDKVLGLNVLYPTTHYEIKSVMWLKSYLHLIYYKILVPGCP